MIPAEGRAQSGIKRTTWWRGDRRGHAVPRFRAGLRQSPPRQNHRLALLGASLGAWGHSHQLSSQKKGEKGEKSADEATRQLDIQLPPTPVQETHGERTNGSRADEYSDWLHLSWLAWVLKGALARACSCG